MPPSGDRWMSVGVPQLGNRMTVELSSITTASSGDATRCRVGQGSAMAQPLAAMTCDPLAAASWLTLG